MAQRCVGNGGDGRIANNFRPGTTSLNWSVSAIATVTAIFRRGLPRHHYETEITSLSNAQPKKHIPTHGNVSWAPRTRCRTTHFTPRPTPHASLSRRKGSGSGFRRTPPPRRVFRSSPIRVLCIAPSAPGARKPARPTRQSTISPAHQREALSSPFSKVLTPT